MWTFPYICNKLAWIYSVLEEPNMPAKVADLSNKCWVRVLSLFPLIVFYIEIKLCILGKSTGFVTTTRVTHATPAALYAHSPERTWEIDADIPDEEAALGCTDIAQQLISLANNTNVMIMFCIYVNYLLLGSLDQVTLAEHHKPTDRDAKHIANSPPYPVKVSLSDCIQQSENQTGERFKVCTKRSEVPF